ncbi:MAG TPA: AraC family transcriptional regulator [Prevotella sp.]|nr:helix-turn-helix domain-containing protein [uncultured Prevotella sp.]HBF04763.1 AraC family transcriptional regulator [Candidatus Segatella violae]
MDYTLYKYSLGIALVLMLFFAFYFLLAKTPEKPIFGNYKRSRRIMAVALLVLSANYSVHLFGGLRFNNPDAAILMNLSTYYLSYWLFSAALISLLDRFFLTKKCCLIHLSSWLAFTILSCVILFVFPKGTWQHAGILLMALWLLPYGIYLAHRIINTYHQAVRLFDDTHSEDISAYIRWMSVFTWWAVIYGVSCGLLTFLPDEYVFLWILSSIPFYIYLYCSYMNYLLFYEQVENILKIATPEVSAGKAEDTPKEVKDNSWLTNDIPAYHSIIKKNLTGWFAQDGYTRPGLNIEQLAVELGTNRTYLSAYIKQTYQMSFREWIAGLRIEYAKRMFVANPRASVSEVSESAGFLSQSYFIKIFTEKEGTSPAKWKKLN